MNKQEKDSKAAEIIKADWFKMDRELLLDMIEELFIAIDKPNLIPREQIPLRFPVYFKESEPQQEVSQP